MHDDSTISDEDGNIAIAQSDVDLDKANTDNSMVRFNSVIEAAEVAYVAPERPWQHSTNKPMGALTNRLHIFEEKYNPYFELDKRVHLINGHVTRRLQRSPEELAAEDRQTLDHRSILEKNLKAMEDKLSGMKEYGGKLMTNVTVAHRQYMIKMNEIHRKETEALEGSVKVHSRTLDASFFELMSRWRELQENPSEYEADLFERMQDIQKDTNSLLNQKDDLINRCKSEVTKMNTFFEQTYVKHNEDLQNFAERALAQADVMNDFYRHERRILEHTLVNDLNLIAKQSHKNSAMFNYAIDALEHEKLDNIKAKREFWKNTMEKCANEARERTRATRIYLEREANKFMLEMRRNIRELYVSYEKMNYDYQLFTLQSEERLSLSRAKKLRIMELKKGISEARKFKNKRKIESDEQIAKLTSEVQQLHDKITEMEQKMLILSAQNKSKFEVQTKALKLEALELAKGVVRIDRILFEQQLHVTWPGNPIIQYEEKETENNDEQQRQRQRQLLQQSQRYLQPTFSNSVKRTSNLSLILAKNPKETRLEMRLLRNILWRLADQGGFLVDSRIECILKPYSERAQTVIRLENIFQILNISSELQSLPALLAAFRPYASCPNCGDMDADGMKLTANTSASKIEQEYSNIQAVTSLASRVKSRSHNLLSTKVENCPDHYLAIAPSLVLVALRQFVNQQTETQRQAYFRHKDLKSEMCKINFTRFMAANILERDNAKLHQDNASCATANDKADGNISQGDDVQSFDFHSFWQKFDNTLPQTHKNIWKALDTGLVQFLQTLRKRAKLIDELKILRKQNREFKFLLQNIDTHDKK